jgi:hypothetical protein
MVIAAVVGVDPPGLTTCDTPADVLVLKLGSPLYAAVSVFVPVVVSVRLQDVAGSVIVH